MRVLWIYAHPEPTSLNASLRDEGIDQLRGDGHTVEISDLYEMGWKAPFDRSDLGNLTDQPNEISRASHRAYEAGTLAADIRAEQAKLLRADTVVMQFPLWWYSTPAILKGWIDRVFTKGFAYGIPDPDHPGRTFRYGRGPLSGRRAQVIVTTGSPEAAMGPRGVNGQLDQVLFPLLHGTLWYVGMDVLPPVAIHGADRISDQDYARSAATVRHRLEVLDEVAPMPYRTQNGGDYDDDLVLRDEIGPDRGGLDVHFREDATLQVHG
jgi:NAD(P)H dehydrogenase (quinone)